MSLQVTGTFTSTAAGPAGAEAPGPVAAGPGTEAAPAPGGSPASREVNLQPAASAVVASTVQGLTPQQFQESGAAAFRKALAQAAGVPEDYIEITNVTQIVPTAGGGRRLSQQAGGTTPALQVGIKALAVVVPLTD